MGPSLPAARPVLVTAVMLRPVFFVLTIALLAIGCASTVHVGHSCDEHGKCPSDSAPSASEAAACNRLLATCGSAFQTYIDCFLDNQVCAADGHTDSAKTVAACQTQVAAASSCVGTSLGSV